MPRPLILFYVLMLFGAPSFGLAAAQPLTPADLRREIGILQSDNQRLAEQVAALTTRVAEAQTERDAALDRVAELEALVARLQQGLDTWGSDPDHPSEGPGEPAPGDPPVATHAPIPDDPMAAPAALLAELVRRFEADFPETDQSPAVLSPSHRDALMEWCLEQSRTLKGPVEWRVRFSDLRELRRNERTVLMAVIDPDSGLPIGETLEVAVPRAHAERLARELGLAGQSGKSQVWTFGGVLTATPKVNPDRATPGVFNHPAFIGPFVEFAFSLDWKAVAVASEEPVAPPEAANAPTSGT